jgi:hypothetical protein
MPPIDITQHIPIESYYLGHLDKAKRRGDQIDSLCPFHGDTSPSFTVNIATGLWHCRAGCGGGDIVEFHARRCNLERSAAFKDLCGCYGVPGVDRKRRGRVPKNPGPDSSSAGVTIPSQPAPPPSSKPNGNSPPTDKKVIAETTLDQFKEIPQPVLEHATSKRGWSTSVIEKYRIGYDPKGQRYTIPIRDEDGDLVNIRRYQPSAAENKIMSWKAGYGQARLFPFSILAETPADQPIFITEGEPDALCGISHGLSCITSTTGAETWQEPFNINFKGRHVIICYDNDEAGSKGIDRVAKFMPVLAKTVESVQWPDFMSEKEDLTDWFMKHGKTVEEFLALPRTKHEKAPSADNKQPPDEDQAVLALNNQHAILMVSGKCLILNEVDDPNFKGRKDITFSSPQDIKLYYADKKKWFADEKGRMKPVSVAKLWLESPHRRKYKGIVFAPGSEQNGFYNLYRGMATEPRPGNWSLFSQHIFDVIANKNQEVYNYVIYWLAHMFQSPGRERPGTALVLQGGQGAGKGKAFADQIGRIWGYHYLHITNQQQITGRFNNHLKDCIFCFIDEGVWAGDKAAEGVLKGMITENYITVEPKGRDPYGVQNFIRLIIASNNNWVVPAGVDERRFCVLRVNDSKQQDTDYFKELLSQMDNGGREAFLYDLMNLDISKVNLREFPRTEALFEQILRTMNSVQKWWYQTLMQGQLLGEQVQWNHAIPTQMLHKGYLEFCAAHNDRYPLMCELFMRELGKLCPIYRHRLRIDGGRTQHVRFPSVDKCREQLSKVLNHAILWDEDGQG